jgi:hypothetical protein
VGLLVLSVVLLSAAQVKAQFDPGLDSRASPLAPHVVAGHVHDDSSSHAEADHPCKGHERSHGVACCLAGSCPLLTGQPPAAPPLTFGLFFAPMSYMALASARLEQAGYAPDPPPPRPGV